MSAPAPATAHRHLRGVASTIAAASGERVHALSEIDLAIAAGEFVSIVGPSGCGKSTLMMLVSGLIPATAGAIEVGGAPVKGAVGKVGIVFQRDVLLDWRTVLDNVLLPVEIKKLDHATHLAARRASFLRSVGLGGIRAEISGASCPAACASAWRSAARWCRTPACF